MADFSALIAQIEAYVKQNGNNEITGNGLQSILVGMVNALGTVAITALQGDLADEVTARTNADGAINAKIPAEASNSNKLADKAFVTGLTTPLQNAVNAINANIENGYVYAGIATPSGTPVSGRVFYLARQAGTYTNFGGLTLTEGVNVLKYNGTAWSQEQLISIADIYKNPLIGYYECDTAGATAAKTVAATGYVLPATGGSVKIKMANRNAVANATLNINSTGAKPLFYNGVRAGVGNTWDTNEIVEVFYDGTNYQAHNVAGSNGDGVFDISAYNLTDGQPTPYVDLAAALGTNGEHVPQSLRKGGMSVKFIKGSAQSFDNNSIHKYVQYRLMANEWSTNTGDWQEIKCDSVVLSKTGSESVNQGVDAGNPVSFYNNRSTLLQILVYDSSDTQKANIVLRGYQSFAYKYDFNISRFMVRTHGDASILHNVAIDFTEDSYRRLTDGSLMMELTSLGDNDGWNCSFKQGDKAIITNKSEVLLNFYFQDYSGSTIQAVGISGGEEKQVTITNVTHQIRLSCSGGIDATVERVDSFDNKILLNIDNLKEETNKLWNRNSLPTIQKVLQVNGLYSYAVIDCKIVKDGIYTITLDSESTLPSNKYLYLYYNEEGASNLIDNPPVSVLKDTVYVLKAKKTADKLMFIFRQDSAVEDFSCTIKVQDLGVQQEGIIGKCSTTKGILIPTRDENPFIEPGKLYYAYIQEANSGYGGTITFEYINSRNGDRVGRVKNMTLRCFETLMCIIWKNHGEWYETRYIKIANPNSVNLVFELITAERYNMLHPRVPFEINYLGCGRSVISPINNQYAHNSYCVCDSPYTYAIYQSDDFWRGENADNGLNNVRLTIIKDGEGIVLTKTLFSDFEFIEKYNDIPLYVPYNHSVLVIGMKIFIRCGFLYNGVQRWMYKTFDLDTWELSTIAPQTLTYNGGTVDWTIANYITMLNTLYGTSFSTSYAPRTVEIANMTAYNGTYYMVCGSNVSTNESSTVVPFVLMSSSDGINWSPIAKVAEDLCCEPAISIKGDKIFLIYRTYGRVSYMVFDLLGNVIKQRTDIVNAADSKPVTFIYNNNVYAIYNIKASNIIPGSAYYYRTSIILSYLNENYELVPLKQYYSAAGFQYYGVGVHNNIVRFVNTEDNGGLNYGNRGPYCQLSLCEIHNEDLVI